MEEIELSQDQENMPPMMEGPMPIEELRNHGFQHSDINKLKEAGFTTIQSIAYNTKKVIAAVKGISDNKADKIAEAWYKLIQMGFQSGQEIEAERAGTIMRISTGSSDLDTMMCGGLETKSITEIYGEFRTGKS